MSGGEMAEYAWSRAKATRARWLWTLGTSTLFGITATVAEPMHGAILAQSDAGQ